MVKLGALVLAYLLVGCTPALPSATNVAQATPNLPPSPSLDPAIAEWIKFRTAVGLRADEAWVREVAANPASRAGSDMYEIPLLPDEIAFLQDRNQRIEDAHAFGASYGAQFPDGFAGAAIDTENGDRLVLLYTKDVELHRLRLTVMPTEFRPEIRQAAWTLGQLTLFQTMVNADTAPDPRIRIYGADIDILANHVRVNYSSNTRKLGDALIKRFNSTGWLFPVWLGPLDREGPVGALRIQVVDYSGVARTGLTCRFVSLDPDIGGGGGADTNPAGECLFEEMPTGPYRIDILSRDEQVERVLKSVEAEVAAGEAQVIRVELPE